MGSGGKKYTLEDLRLDVEAAEAGHPEKLIPIEWRGIVDELELPSMRADLERLAVLPTKRGRHPWDRYVRRCRAELAKRNARCLEGPPKQAMKAMIETSRIRTMKRDAKIELDGIIEGVREEAARVTATIRDLDGLARGVLAKQMQGYIENKEVNGEPVTHTEAARAAATVMTQFAKIGHIDPAEKADAQDLIVTEFVAELRRRLEIGASIAVKAVEVGQGKEH